MSRRIDGTRSNPRAVATAEPPADDPVNFVREWFAGEPGHHRKRRAERLRVKLGDMNRRHGIILAGQPVVDDAFELDPLRVGARAVETQDQRPAKRLRRVIEREAKDRCVITAGDAGRRLRIGKPGAIEFARQIVQELCRDLGIVHRARLKHYPRARNREALIGWRVAPLAGPVRLQGDHPRAARVLAPALIIVDAWCHPPAVGPQWL